MPETKMEIWNALKHPPESALKKISGGRMNGKTDIHPQWRYQAMTEQFGPIGIGWKFTIDEHWSEPILTEVLCHVRISLFIKQGDIWSEPIPGIGGNKTVAIEKAGPHISDEGYKMALTDALSVAMKLLGVAADIYMGLCNGSKYQKQANQPAQQQKTDISLDTVKSADWTKYLQGFANTKDALAGIAQTYIISNEVHAYVSEFYQQAAK